MSTGNGKKNGSQIAIIVGVILIAVGAWHLLGQIMPTNLLGSVFGFFRTLWGLVWPCALVAAGIYLLLSARAGKLSGFKQGCGSGPLRRSRADKRIFGVCGGIAYYFSVDSTVVRIVVALLFVAFPPMVAIAYLLIALFVPQS